MPSTMTTIARITLSFLAGAALANRLIMGPTLDRRRKIKALKKSHDERVAGKTIVSIKTLGEYKMVRSSRRHTWESMLRVQRGELDNLSTTDVVQAVANRLQPSDSACLRPPLSAWRGGIQDFADADDCRCEACIQRDGQPVILAGDHTLGALPTAFIPRVGHTLFSFGDVDKYPNKRVDGVDLWADHAVALSRSLGELGVRI